MDDIKSGKTKLLYMHRLCHSLHDLGFHTGTGAQIVCYGFATVMSGVCAVLLLTF